MYDKMNAGNQVQGSIIPRRYDDPPPSVFSI